MYKLRSESALKASAPDSLYLPAGSVRTLVQLLIAAISPARPQKVEWLAYVPPARATVCLIVKIDTMQITQAQRTVKRRIPESLYTIRPNTNLLPHIIPRDDGGSTSGGSGSMIHNHRSKRRERTRRPDDLIERPDSSAHPVRAGRERDRVLTKVVDIDV